MNFILTVLSVIAIDRIIPVATWVFGITSFKTGLADVLRAYKLVSFPRTLFAVFVCAPDIAAMFIKVDRDTLDKVVMALYFIFAVTAVFDAMRAVRSGGYRQKPVRTRSD
jgi:hypothetical protein